MQSVEDLTDAAIATLIAKLPAQLLAVNAKYAGTLRDIGELPVPRSDEVLDNPTGDYWPGGVSVVTRYPTIEVAVPDLDGADFSIGQHESDAAPALVVRAWLSHAQLNILYRQCCRFGAAIYNVLADPQDSGRGSGFGEDVVISRYSLRWRYNPDTETRDEIQSAVVLIYYLDAPDVRP